MKKLIIDNRMRAIEKGKLKELGYRLIEINSNKKLYPEISSHTDIFCTKIKNNLIIETSQYDLIKNNIINEIDVIKGNSIVENNYPQDIKYNVCILGKYAIHNFNYTDSRIKEILQKEKYNLINVKQGYTKCSIAVIDENSIIISDKGLYEELKQYNFDILFLNYKLNIKLLNKGKFSSMNGFVGGAISRIGDNIFISGNLNEIDRKNEIRNFIQKRNLHIISFKDLDVIDYGGIIEI
ncbi:MAG: hypothetical protein J5507_06885 [Clostridia bacterium]|nr:hypothetical protein [Clostridia bacterium]